MRVDNRDDSERSDQRGVDSKRAFVWLVVHVQNFHASREVFSPLRMVRTVRLVVLVSASDPLGNLDHSQTESKNVTDPND